MATKMVGGTRCPTCRCWRDARDPGFELPAGRFLSNASVYVCRDCAEKRLSEAEFRAQLERKPPPTDLFDTVASVVGLLFMAAVVLGLAWLGFEDMERNGWYIRP